MKWKMIFKRRFTAALLVLLCGAFVSSEEFKVDSDDLQIVYSDPTEAVVKSSSRYLYAKETEQCPAGERRTMLTLLLHSLKWNDISDKKSEKAIKKLSRFFLVPKQFITVSDIHTPEILEMLKHSINKSNNLLNTKDTVARVEFMIGCGDKMFSNGKDIAHHINEYVTTGLLDELSGLPFNWWNIWSKRVKSRVQRMRRDAAGSGNGEGEPEYDYDDEDEDQDGDEESEDENIDESTETTRVRHNQKNKKKSSRKHSKKISVAQVQDEPVEERIVVPETVAVEVEEEEAISENVPEEVSEPEAEIPQTPFEVPEVAVELPQLPIEIPLEIESITQTNTAGDGNIDMIENIKLETFVNKTIVNDNNVVDVPVFEEKDKMLEEVRKMISEPPTDGTTVTDTTVTESSTIHHVPETTTTEAPTTIQEVEETNTVSTIPAFVIASTPAPETETIFIPIMTNNNENINAYEEKFPVATTTESSPRLEDEVTELMSTPVHETTYISITTSPPTTEILTTTETSTITTTVRIVDATIALDKIPTTNVEGEDEEEEIVRPQKPTKVDQKKPDEESESNYDDEYDDNLPDEDVNSVGAASPTQRTSTTAHTTTYESRTVPPVPSTTQQERETSTESSTTAAPSTVDVTTEAAILLVTPEDYSDENTGPRVDRRLQKSAVTAGKPFIIKVDDNVFYDEEDKTNLRLELLSHDGNLIPSTSWIRFDPEKREIYGLPLESDVSQYKFKLRAYDSAGLHVDEDVAITVQQYKSYRSANHEIFIQVSLEKRFESAVDWMIRLVRGIVEALDDESTGHVVVREVRPNKHSETMFTFVYTNETLPKDHCPKAELEKLMTRLTKSALNEAMKREISVRTVEKDLIGSCQERQLPKPPAIPSNTNNFPPTVRNPVDKITAYVGQLLVYEVPKDTFYDPEDFTELKLTLLLEDRKQIDPNHWLQFDSKNREFYGIPTLQDKTQQYILVAQDKNGLTTNDALVVEVHQGTFKKDYSATFEYQLDIGSDQFQTAASKRKFVENIARIFQEPNTKHILMRQTKKLQYAGRTSVIVQNTTLNQMDCPNNRIEKIRRVLLQQDGSIRDEVKTMMGADFNLLKINIAPTSKCAAGDSFHHMEEVTTKPEEDETPVINQEVLITYVLPTAIILLMLLIALLIACLLYKRRNTGKMELGDEEERKSFRSKGIPVIFQDELEEKPEIVTKSPVILKDEKPPLLPQYNGMTQDGDDDNMDQYIPPQPLLMGSRESRGKSPVTPSYRKPPPYVSP